MAKKRAEVDDASDAEGGKKSKLPSKKVMMIGAAALVTLLGGGGGYWFFMKGKAGDTKLATTVGADGKTVTASTGTRKPTAFLDLPEMTVNLAASGTQSDRQQFLRMKIALEVSEQKVVADIQPLLPRIVDTFQIFMRELRPQDLEGSAGVYRLKEEMIRRVNVAVYPQKVDAVLFKELMVQ